MNIWTFLIVAGSVWALFQILAVLVCMRFTKLRGTAVVEWQDRDVKDRPDWDHDEVEVIAQLVMAPDAEEETEEDVDDFRLWAREVSMQRGIRRGLKRMERLP